MAYNSSNNNPYVGYASGTYQYPPYQYQLGAQSRAPGFQSTTVTSAYAGANGGVPVSAYYPQAGVYQGGVYSPYYQSTIAPSLTPATNETVTWIANYPIKEGHQNAVQEKVKLMDPLVFRLAPNTHCGGLSVNGNWVTWLIDFRNAQHCYDGWAALIKDPTAGGAFFDMFTNDIEVEGIRLQAVGNLDTNPSKWPKEMGPLLPKIIVTPRR